MKKATLFCAAVFGALTNAVMADELPVYDAATETLRIPAVSVQGQPGQQFQDVVLEPAGDGLWRVAELFDGVLMDEQYVEEVWTSSTTGLPRQFFIHVAGTFSNGCPSVGRIEQRRVDNVIEVFIYDQGGPWLRDPESVACTLALVPFEVTIPLQIHGLPAGEYSVRINNNALRTFVLDEDNAGPNSFGGQRGFHCQYEPLKQTGLSSYGCVNESDITLQ